MSGAISRKLFHLNRGKAVGVLLRSHTDRHVSTTNVLLLKEIIENTSSDGKTITIEGVNVSSSRVTNMVNYDKLQQSGYANRPQTNEDPKSDPCPLCRLGLEVKHTDVLILQQFLDPSGNVLQRNVTGLCLKQHRRMDYLIQMAKLAGILKTPLDPEPKERPGYMKYNKYYDESVIDEWLAGKRRRKA